MLITLRVLPNSGRKIDAELHLHMANGYIEPRRLPDYWRLKLLHCETIVTRHRRQSDAASATHRSCERGLSGHAAHARMQEPGESMATRCLRLLKRIANCAVVTRPIFHPDQAMRTPSLSAGYLSPFLKKMRGELPTKNRPLAGPVRLLQPSG